jgi:hypothetical protein
MDELGTITREGAAQVKQMELERLNSMQMALWPQRKNPRVYGYPAAHTRAQSAAAGPGCADQNSVDRCGWWAGRIHAEVDSGRRTCNTGSTLLGPALPGPAWLDAWHRNFRR